MSGARRVAVVAVTIAACALVALAARGDRRSGDGAAFELRRGSATASGAAVIVVTLVAIALLGWGLWRPGGAKRPPRRSWRDTVIPIVIGVLLAFALATQRPDQERSGEASEPASEVGGEVQPRGDEQPLGEGPSATASILIAVLALAALGAAGAVARRRRDRISLLALDVAPSDATFPESAAAALPIDGLVAGVEAEPDDRQAVLMAFAAAERFLAPTPLARRATASPREWLAHIRRAARDGTDIDVVTAIGSLIGCYEVARFSNHPIDSADRARAIDALRVIARVAGIDATPVSR